MSDVDLPDGPDVARLPMDEFIGRPAWMSYGNCNGADPDLFFPERGHSTREAKEVCAHCTVREQCLDYALENGEKFGIWGGKSERERRRLRRSRTGTRPPVVRDRLLKNLADHGGDVRDRLGRADMRIGVATKSDGQVLTAAVQAGLVTRERLNDRRGTTRLTLTEAGWAAIGRRPEDGAA